MKQLAVSMLLAGWHLAAAPARADDPADLGVKAKTILQAHCADCHGGGKAAKGGFGFVLDRDRLISRNVVVPGKANQSDLFVRIENGEMPPPSRKNRPTVAEITILRRWIDAGAPMFDASNRATQVISEQEVPGVILADLEQLEPRRRRFTRYLTLTHLAFANLPEHELERTRAATGKLLNSLSWHPRAHVPQPIAGGTILRLDLRDYKWSAASWDKVSGVYPYRFPGTATHQQLTRLTGAELPAMRADWFVATAARPPLYHDLLQLPTTDRALERLLQVDAPGNLQEDNVQRSGFNDSGVSKNNRLLERHDAVHGVLWRSYDFANNFGRQNLFDHPVGPNTGATSFQPAGGEMIFHLPNGLQGYLLVDALGRRIDKAPSEIVADPRRSDQRVETGISCMSCHARGLLFKADQLRGHVEKNGQVFGPAAVASVRALHPRPVKMKAQIEEDNDRYLKALAPFGIRDPDQEPVNLVAQRYEATLAGRSAAAELGLTIKEFGDFLKREPSLARVFGGLLAPGGTVQREVFQENFAELARRLSSQQAALAKAATTEASTAPFHGHSATVNCVAIATDGQRAASGSDDRTVRIWDVATGKELACLKGGGAEVLAIAFSHDGKWLLSGGRDKWLRVWDAATGKQLRVLSGHTDAIRCVAFAPDGKHAVSGGDDRSLRLWDLATGQETAALAGHSGPITSVACSRDGRHVLSGSRDGTARWWNLASQSLLCRLDGHAGPVLCVALAPDGQAALTGGNDKTLRFWKLATAKEVHCFKGHENAVIHAQFSGTGDIVYSSSSQHRNAERAWRRWDLKQQMELDSRSPDAAVSFGCAAFAPDGRQVLVGGVGGFLRMFSW